MTSARGDPAAGPEGAVRVAANPAQSGCAFNLVLRPVAGNIGEIAVSLDAGFIKPGADGRELSASDGRIRVKGLRSAAIHDAQPGQGGDSRVAPQVLVDIYKGVGGGQVFRPDLRVEQPKKDRDDFSAADVIQRTDGAVCIADNIGRMIPAIEPWGHLWSPSLQYTVLVGVLDFGVRSGRPRRRIQPVKV